MIRLRGALGPVAAVWLLAQAAALVVVPAIFYAGSTAAPIECTCLHGDHSDCPMHHKSPVGPRVCFETTDSTGLAVLASSLGHVGLVPRAPCAFTFIPPRLAVQFDETSKTLRPAAPDPPPPRA